MKVLIIKPYKGHNQDYKKGDTPTVSPSIYKELKAGKFAKDFKAKEENR